MKIGPMIDFPEIHPFPQRLMQDGKILKEGVNLMGRRFLFIKDGPFLYSLNWNSVKNIMRKTVLIERIAKSEKYLFMQDVADE